MGLPLAFGGRPFLLAFQSSLMRLEVNRFLRVWSTVHESLLSPETGNKKGRNLQIQIPAKMMVIGLFNCALFTLSPASQSLRPLGRPEVAYQGAAQLGGSLWHSHPPSIILLNIPIRRVKQILLPVQLIFHQRLPKRLLHLALPGHRILSVVKTHNLHNIVNIADHPLHNDGRLLVPRFLKQRCLPLLFA
jgi:hypothetical protein